jgi:RNA polymerase sigma-70 factor (ECF subfamily)
MTEHGDETQLEDFLARDYARVVGAVGLVCGSRAVTEDAVSEAMVRAWEWIRRGRTIDSLPAWITVVALNQARSWGRRRRAEAHAVERLHALERDRRESAGSRTALALDVWQALQALPRRQREVTVLRFYLDLDVRSIAAMLEISDGSVKTSLSRARQALGRAIGTPTGDGTEAQVE